MPEEYLIEVSLGEQRLYLQREGRLIAEYPVSTARNGAGERLNSECTPRGHHRIADKIGDGCVVGTVFVGRQPTGEIYHRDLRAQYPERDWILTRILRLEGTEEGVNRGGDVDTFSRYIYIHGTPDDVRMGEPGSHGCIRMRNEDILSLFERVPAGTGVIIRE